MKEIVNADFDIDHIKHIAKVYKLRLSQEDKVHLVAQLSKTKEYLRSFKKLHKRTSSLLPTYHVCGLYNSYRVDIVASSMDLSDVFLNAKNTKDGCFTIPGLFKEKVNE